MKKVIMLLAIFVLSFSIPTFADEKTPTLSKANIQVISGENHAYQVKEEIQISNAESVENHKLVLTFSYFDGTKMEDLKVLSNGQALNSHLEKGKTLGKLYVDLPDNAPGDFTYELNYSLILPTESFTAPLFVPTIPSKGSANVVHITFQAPKGKKIQKNSFPVVLKSGDETVTNHIMSIPSQVRYVYSDKNFIFNGFNIVSWITILILLGIILIWIKSETNHKREVAL